MSSPEPSARSKRLVTAAAAERRRLLRDLARLEARTRTLREQLAELERKQDEVRQELALLAHFAHQDDDSPFPQRPQLQVIESTEAVAEPPPRGYLRGGAIRQVAVRVLAATESPSKPIHYADWYDLIVAAGYGIAGRDPRASFLTQIGRSPLVRRTSERGLYALDLAVPRELRARLHSLHQELAGLIEGQQTIGDVATVAERRGEVTAELVRVQRELEEALASLGAEPPTE